MTPRTRLFAMSWAHLLNDGAANYLPGVLAAVLVSMKAPAWEAGVLMGALFIGQGLQPVIGLASDHVGGKAITLGGMCVATTAGGLVGLAPNQWVLIPLLGVIGVANSCFHPQALAGVRLLAGRRRGLSTSVFIIGGELGRGIWPFAAGLVVTDLGLPYVWLLAAPMAVCLPWLIVSFPSLPPRRPDTPPIRWREHLGPMGRIVLFTSLRTTLVFLLVTFLPLWWQARGGRLDIGSALVGVMYTVGIVGSAMGGHLADQWGARRTALAGSAASVVLLAGLPLCTGALLWVVAALTGVSLFIHFPISIALGQDAVPEKPSMGSGVALGLCNAISAVAVMLLGLTVGRVGYVGMLWAAAILSVPAALAALLLPEHHHAVHPPADTEKPGEPDDEFTQAAVDAG